MFKLALIIVTGTIFAMGLNACTATQAANNTAPLGVESQSRNIDWDRAEQDAKVQQSQLRVKPEEAVMAVPLLLLPVTVDTSGEASRRYVFSEPRLLVDKKGYAAVIESPTLTVLIDASDQMMKTTDAGNAAIPDDFDGRWMQIRNGLQTSIGRYGALYSLQFICTDVRNRSCITQQQASEILQSLQVFKTLP